jgi:hypothetical protein
MTRVRSAEEFWALVDMRDQRPEECWEWQGSRYHGDYQAPYGQASWPGHPLGAHRVSWELTYGPIPADRCVLHWCDNPPCVRPDHLWLGTQRMNVQHAVITGRHRGPRLMDHYGTRKKDAA